MIIAHRGASKDAPENTLPAFELAWKQSADGIEGDFRLTRDGQIVCIHDGTTERVAGTSLVVSESTLADLRQLDVGSYRGAEFKGTVIPTLDEVLATIPAGKRIYIEIKCGVEIIIPMIELIHKAGLDPDQVVIISFNRDVIKAVRKTAPQFKAYVLCTIKHSLSGLPDPDADTLIKMLKACGADGLSSNIHHLDQQLVDSISAAGFEYHVWTVDNAEDARRLLNWGIRSVTTNVPGYIRKELT